MHSLKTCAPMAPEAFRPWAARCRRVAVAEGARLMKRWGLVGAMVLAACAPETPATRDAQHQPCPGVTAGELGHAPQGLSMPRPEDGDGREAVFIHYRGDGVSASSLARHLGVEVKAT